MWVEPPLGHKRKITQLTRVLITHAQPFLHADFVHETEATPAIARTNQELPYVLVLGIPGCLADPTCWCVGIFCVTTNAFSRQGLCEAKEWQRDA